MDVGTARISDLFDGRLRPVSEARPSLTSAGTPWVGFLLERDGCSPGFAETLTWWHDQLVVVTRGVITVADAALAGEKRFVAAAGSVTYWPAGHESKAIAWASRHEGGGLAEMVRIQLDPEVMLRLAPERIALRREQRLPQPRPAANDAVLSALARLMTLEVAAGCPSGQLYAESLSLAVTARVYADTLETTGLVKGGLSRLQLARVCDYIEQHLGQGLSLVELAGQAGLSPRHFAVRFRCSTGVTPHKYVLARRIERAKRLLAAPGALVVDVALALGFSSQSHFSDLFRRTVGTTPRQFQRMR